MHKQEMIDKIREVKGCSRREAAEMFETVIDIIRVALKSEGEAAIREFGTFKRVTRAARECRNPRNGEKIALPEHEVVVFKPAKSFFGGDE